MNLTNKVIVTFVFVIFATYILSLFKNNSNFSKLYVIPLIVAALAKYIIGDFDEGYQWTVSDVVYWIVIICVSYTTLKFVN